MSSRIQCALALLHLPAYLKLASLFAQLVAQFRSLHDQLDTIMNDPQLLGQYETFSFTGASGLASFTISTGHSTTQQIEVETELSEELAYKCELSNLYERTRSSDSVKVVMDVTSTASTSRSMDTKIQYVFQDDDPLDRYEVKRQWDLTHNFPYFQLISGKSR